MSTPSNKALLVSDVMMSVDKFPVIGETVILKEALEEMGKSHLGIACIVNDSHALLGILTDGDIRRKLLKVQKPFSAFFVDDALEHAIRSPATIQPMDTLVDAVNLMEQKQIWDLPVVGKHNILVGLLHLHPAIQALLAMNA
jgi:arabinose-5-phosphate isomerase